MLAVVGLAVKFPDKHTCHDERQFHVAKGEWRPAEVDARNAEDYARDFPFRTCDYCGSIHPEDLLNALRNGATLHGCDWKYGWPHKFYVEGIPSGLRGQLVVLSIRYARDEAGVQTTTPEKYVKPADATAYAKWYSEHLVDDGLDDEAFGALAGEILKHAGIEFVRNGTKIGYRRVSGQREFGERLP